MFTFLRILVKAISDVINAVLVLERKSALIECLNSNDVWVDALKEILASYL